MLATPDWESLNPVVLAACRKAQQRGAALMFAAPFLGVPLVLGAYFAIPQTAIPALIAAIALVAFTAHLAAGRSRLQRAPIHWLRVVVRKKIVRQSTNSSSRQVSRSYYLSVQVEESLQLDHQGRLQAASSANGTFQTTAPIYKGVAEGAELWAVVMPHDGAIYYVVDDRGQLFPAPEREDIAAQAS